MKTSQSIYGMIKNFDEPEHLIDLSSQLIAKTVAIYIYEKLEGEGK